MLRHRVGPVALALILALTAAAALPAPALADGHGAQVTVVHGVPGLTVDVYVNGSLVLPSFAPGTVTDPLPLPAGTYDLAVVPEGGDLADAVLEATATLADGDNVSVVAHLDATGAPALTLFANDLSLPDPGEGRVVVRHAAAAPAVDVKLERRWWRWRRPAGMLTNLANGDEGSADVRAGRYRATIFPAGGDDAVAPPAPLKIRRDRATIVYAVGSLSGGTFQLLVQELVLTGTTAAVSVVHGVPGLTVDVYVNGDLLLPSFVPGRIAGPLDLAPGTYDVAIVPEGGDPASPAIAGSATVRAGDNVSLVAHLDAAGAPVLGAFVNDVSSAGAWRSRLDVRHAAAAPAVDVILQRCIGWRFVWWRRVRDVENGEQKGLRLLPGYYLAEVTLAGNAGARVLGPAPLCARHKRLYAIYAIGSATAGTLDLLVQVLPLRR